MDHFEMVEKLREKANVSYEEAKAALEACDWDILDALVLLESEGKVSEKKGANYSTEEKNNAPKDEPHQKNAKINGKKILGFISSLINKGSENAFVLKRKGEEIMRLPIIVLILLLIFLFQLMLILLAIGLFCGVRYSFEGPLFKQTTVNHVMDKAADKADEIKHEVQGEVK